MPRGTPVPITPSVLAWAIRESGYSQEEVAAKLGVEVDTLRDWERGAEQPILTQFKKLSALLKRPSATFLLPQPPDVARTPVQFRHPPGTGRATLNPTELRYLREASRLQRTLSWIIGELGEEVAQLPEVRVGSNSEESGAAARWRLAVSVDDQFGWRNASEALRGWRTALENSGVLVFLFPLGKSSCRGFSLWDSRAPLIAVNTWWNPEARMFTLFHEYAHLLSRTNSACIHGGRYRLSDQADPTERWCEEFSAAVLIPWEAVAQFMRVELSWSPNMSIEDLNQVRQLAHRFKVSLRAMTLRLIGKGIASWDLYSEIPDWSDEKRGGGGSGRTRREIKEDLYGNRPTRLFLNAIREELVSRADALSFLDVSDSDLDELQRQEN